jgi:2-polyprenyl-3-methyl-5-hydroxy-6-metoxy-1,4-benzoquinol methylase
LSAPEGRVTIATRMTTPADETDEIDESAEIARRMREIVDSSGPWTSYNLELAPGVYTMGSREVDMFARVRRVVQLVTDLSSAPLETLRIIDLASLEGAYTIEFARRGATVVGVEARGAHVERSRFAAEVLRVPTASFVQDDVRNLSAERYGHFDVVLCFGILYHLDWPDPIRPSSGLPRCVRASPSSRLM